ncbi:MAG: hypothetical protein WDA24_00315 [Tissierellales bacterium]
MGDKKSKSSRLMKVAIALFAIGFGTTSFQIFMRLVYMTEKYMARWQMWVWFVVGAAFLIPAFTLFYLANKEQEREREAFFNEYFEQVEHETEKE